MFDSIHIRVPHQLVTSTHWQQLHKACIIHNVQTGVRGEIIFGSYKNFKVTINEHGVMLNGSLAKFVNGQNVTSINFQQARDGLYALQSELGIPILKGQLQRVDLAESFVLSGHVLNYFRGLLPSPGYNRIASPRAIHGVRYQKGDNIVFACYNKTDEAVVTPAISFDIDRQHVVRFELRILKNVRRTVINRTKKFGVVYLLSPSFHRLLAAKWCEHYCSIVKQRQLVEFGEMLVPKDFDRYLLSYAVQKMGVAACNSAINIIAESNNWDPRKKDTAKSNVLQYATSHVNTKPNQYIDALDTAVAGSYIYSLYRGDPPAI